MASNKDPIPGDHFSGVPPNITKDTLFNFKLFITRRWNQASKLYYHSCKGLSSNQKSYGSHIVTIATKEKTTSSFLNKFPLFFASNENKLFFSFFLRTIMSFLLRNLTFLRCIFNQNHESLFWPQSGFLFNQIQELVVH